MKPYAEPVWKEIGYGPPLAAADVAGRRAPVVIVGGGPIGLSLALDLGRRGLSVIVLNAATHIPRGSKAICFSKRSLEIFDRLGVVEPMLAKGVRWERGKVFWRDAEEPVYEFDLAPVKRQKHPAFINIQQYYVEEYLVEAAARTPSVSLRWGHQAVDVRNHSSGVEVDVATPDGPYTIEADYLVACDGVRSFVRKRLGLDFEGRAFEDNFLIADVRFKEERASERWFRFEPPYPGASSLSHKQPDGVWRLDFQLGPDIDKEKAATPAFATPFVLGMLGSDVEFEFEWISVYSFQCRRMQRFLHGRVLFAGDAAHVVSPFGARGCNGGLQDVDNLGWKLARVHEGSSPPALLRSYDAEATHVADVNILNSTRSTDFMTPKTAAARRLRDAVLSLARENAFAQPFVNSGRLSKAVPYSGSPLNAEDDVTFAGGLAPGETCLDAPVNNGADDWLLSSLGGDFAIILFTDDDVAASSLSAFAPARVVQISRTGAGSLQRLVDREGLAFERCGASEGAIYLIRPDQHVAARFGSLDPDRLNRAYARAAGLAPS